MRTARLVALLAILVAGCASSPGPTGAAADGPGATPFEQRGLDLANGARGSAALRPVAFAADLLALARAHCADMNARHYLDHTTPDGKALGDRLREAGIRCSAAGENVALVRSDDPAGRAHELWMRSDGHRRNILNPAFAECAVAVLRSSDAEGYYFLTEVFVTRDPS